MIRFVHRTSHIIEVVIEDGGGGGGGGEQWRVESGG